MRMIKRIYFQSVFSNVRCHFLSISNNLVLEAFNIKNMYVNAVSMQLNMNWVGTKIPVDVNYINNLINILCF